MWKITIVFLVVTCFVVTNAANKDPFAAAIEDVYGNDFSQDNKTANFDWSLFKNIHNMGVKNGIISPFSLKICLMILYEAATGKTQDELRKVLNLTDSEEENRKKYESMLKYFQLPRNSYKLDIGTRMYLDSSVSPNHKYQAILNSSYKTQVAKLDVNNPFKAAKDANEWARNVTNGNIENLVSEDDMRNVVILLLNGIYFKGTWKYQFPPEDTSPATFYLNSTHTLTTPMMKLNNRFDFLQSKELKSKIIKLPYKGDDVSMYIVLPDTVDGLSNLVAEMDSMKLEKAMTLMENTLVDLEIPTFKFKYTSRLVAPLQKLGIIQIFEKSASVPKIARGSGLTTKLSVSNIFQKAGIDVNEVGTTAYATSAISLVNKFDEGIEEFKANKPFLFYLHEKLTNQILFMGTVDIPNDSKPIPITRNPGRH